MSYSLIPTPHFKSQAKKLAKHYRSLKDDLKDLTDAMKENPFVGADLGQGVHKIRLEVASKGKGKGED